MRRAEDCGRNLPDLFTCLDGTEIECAEAWVEKRRPELLGLFRDHVYGNLPDMSDVKVEIRVACEKKGPDIMAGRAVRKTLEIQAERNGIHFSFPAVVFIPLGAQGPVPVLLTVCNRGIKDGDPARHFLSPFWPAESMVARGYASAVVLTQDIAPDYDEDFTMGFLKLFPEYVGSGRSDNAWGALSAWAWGASRIMDYFVEEPLIDWKRVAVVGHSRGGKTALWCAAQDERFAMAVSSSAGNSGDALARKSKGERVRDIVERFPYWFCKNYQKYADHEDALPVDQHMLLALLAPRLVYITSKTFDSWADPQGQFTSCVQASPAYWLLGKEGMPLTVQPLPECPVHGGEIGYHLKTGNHDLDEYDWEQIMDFADRKL